MHKFDFQYLADHLTYLKDAVMHDLPANYLKIRNTLRSIASEYFDEKGNTRFYPHTPKMSDLEIISLTIAAECVQITSENLLWCKLQKDYPTMISNLVHRVCYNRRKKSLREVFLRCTEKMAEAMVTKDEPFIIDSIPIPISKIVRERSSKACRRLDKDLVVADKGFNPMVGGYYIGYKMHLISSESGVYRDLLITEASAHDSIFLKEISNEDEHLRNRLLLGDRGYIGHVTQLRLFDEVGISLEVPYRKNQKDFKVYDPDKRLKRKSIEVVFSQYCDEFQLRQNYAKRFSGFEIRITSKIAAKTFKQYWNFIHGRPINQTKHALAA